MNQPDLGHESRVRRFRLSVRLAAVGLLLAWFGAFILYDRVGGALHWLWLPPYVIGLVLAIVGTVRMFSIWRERRQVRRRNHLPA